MGKTSIEWCDFTFNPWWGCTKVSDGCKHCYADTLSHRYGLNVWGPTAARKPMSETYWKQPIAWNRKAKEVGERHRVFCASMADVFEGTETCQDPASYFTITTARERLWDLIGATPHLDWLLLTKRPESVNRFIPPAWHNDRPLPANVWVGTSVENQATADKRIPELLKVDAQVRFLSCEPLLGAVSLTEYLTYTNRHYQRDASGSRTSRFDEQRGRFIHWVIVGGESGPNARPMHPGWALSLRDQCVSAGVPFHFKQWGEYRPTTQQEDEDFEGVLVDRTDKCGYYCDESVGHVDHGATPMKRVGKKSAGRILDGRTWGEFPPPPIAPIAI